MKKFAALSLSLALTASLAVPALAAEEPVQIVPISATVEDSDLLLTPAGEETAPEAAAPAVPYAGSITVNGVALDTSLIPAPSAEGLVPLRLIAESDHGSASWFESENSAAFSLTDAYITVSFADNSITLESEPVEAKA